MEDRSTGYGPRHGQGRYARLCFDGDERHYEQWEVKFLGYMRLQKLKDIILPPAGAATDRSDDNNKKLSYRRETARQLRIHAQLTRCFSAVAV